MEYYPKISKAEFLEFEQYYLISLLKDSKVAYGRQFCMHFPEVAEYMARNSNLGTPPGVYHPNDDVILGYIKDPDEAKSFIEERVEFTE